MLEKFNVARLTGATAYDPDGAITGTIARIYVDPANGKPNWATVKTGLFGGSASFVPLVEADEVDGGLRLPYTKDIVKNAPPTQSDAELTEAETSEMRAYYQAATEPFAGPDSVA